MSESTSTPAEGEAVESDDVDGHLKARYNLPDDGPEGLKIRDAAPEGLRGIDEDDDTEGHRLPPGHGIGGTALPDDDTDGHLKL